MYVCMYVCMQLSVSSGYCYMQLVISTDNLKLAANYMS